MKKITLTFALVAMTTLSAWAFTFPEELGTAEYGKVADVPKELKEATILYDKADIAGFTIAQYYGAYGVTGICSFDADMNAFFPPKDWLKEKTRFVGANDANQIIAIKNAKKGAEIALFDAKMNLLNKVLINADVYSEKSVAKMYVADGKIYLILWQYNKKPSCWMGYILDANNLQILSQTELGTSWESQFTYSKNREYIACVAIDENKGKYLRHPLYNGANIKLYDKNFSLLKERYVYGNIDDPWVWAQDEKTRKKIYNGGMTGVLTNGDYQVQMNNDGVLRYITLDAASAHKVTASTNEIIPIRNNRLTVYTLSAGRNDSISLTDLMTDKIFMRQTLIKADDNNVTLMAWYKVEKRQTASTGYVVLNWNAQTNELTTLKEEQKIFPAESYEDPKRILYKDESGMLVEHIRNKDKGTMYYDMWCSADGKDIRFPRFESPAENTGFQAINYMLYVKPIQSRAFITHSEATDVSCFLVHESLNTGVNADLPIENTNPLYLEFINKDGKLAEYVFPKTYDNVGFGLLGFRKSYKSTMNVTASSIDDTSIRLYLQSGKQHQWVTLHPNMFSKEYKESHPDKF